jgi:hypothetical protein
VAADNVTATYARVTGETVGSYISATLAPTESFGESIITSPTPCELCDNSNASVVVVNLGTLKFITVYRDHKLTGVVSGFMAADNVTAT